MQRPAANRGAHQRGLSLPTVLMFLVIITVVGTVGIRRATVTEALSRNQLDYEVARQAAEAALRDAERDLALDDKGLTGVVQPGARCARFPGERPVSAFGPSPTCLRGQCRFAGTYYAASNFATGTNPMPYWPGAQGGLWVAPGTADTPATALTQKPRAGSTGNCLTFTGGVPLGTFTGVAAFASVAQQPEYLIEFISDGAGAERMRITARGFGTDPRTEVVLQSYFNPPGAITP